jgi:hypothetical protein
MGTRRAGAVGVSAALLLASAAAAGLPRSGLIVPGKSIGAVHLGETFAAAHRTWGASGKCSTTNAVRYCSYSGSPAAGRATVGATRGTIVSISVTAAYDPTTKKFVSATPLAAFHTSKGIHLGSTTAAVMHAYPTIESASSAELKLVAGKRSTLFLIFGGTVYDIAVQRTP